MILLPWQAQRGGYSGDLFRAGGGDNGEDVRRQQRDHCVGVDDRVVPADGQAPVGVKFEDILMGYTYLINQIVGKRMRITCVMRSMRKGMVKGRCLVHDIPPHVHALVCRLDGEQSRIIR